MKKKRSKTLNYFLIGSYVFPYMLLILCDIDWLVALFVAAMIWACIVAVMCAFGIIVLVISIAISIWRKNRKEAEDAE